LQNGGQEVRPFYTPDDIPAVLQAFKRVNYGVRTELGNGVAFTFLTSDVAEGVLDGVVCVILMTALVVILDRILRRTAVTVQSLAGALSAYLIIGMFFASLYGLMDAFTAGPFFASGEAANARSFQYFSYTTLTTLGYGDYTAALFPGRSIATFEALVGQVFLAVLVARLVAAFHGRSEAIMPPKEDGA